MKPRLVRYNVARGAAASGPRRHHPSKGRAMRHKTITGAIGCGAILIGVVLIGGPASAQPPETQTRSAVAECICARDALPTLGHELRAERRHYEHSRSTAKALQNQVDSSRGTVNVNDRADVEAFKTLVERRDAARRAFDAESVRYNAAVEHYNRAASRNNAACSGRLFDPAEVAQVQATLECPRP
ncbi:MAG: hypothetical protein ACREFD_01260 [Stellaceae bacterium]